MPTHLHSVSVVLKWIDDIAHVFGVDIPEKSHDPESSEEKVASSWKSRREADLLNEFEEMELIHTGAFLKCFSSEKHMDNAKVCHFSKLDICYFNLQMQQEEAVNSYSICMM